MRKLFKSIDKELVVLIFKLLGSVISFIFVIAGLIASYNGDYAKATYYFVVSLLIS